MPHCKTDSFDYVLHLMLYGLGAAGTVCFAFIAYLESQI